jgi:hypothetical protein
LLGAARAAIDGSAICCFAFTRNANGEILPSEREDGRCWYRACDGRGNRTGRRVESCAGSHILRLWVAAEEGYWAAVGGPAMANE